MSVEIVRAARSAGTPVVFVVGPTASGKSAVALSLAQEFGGAIVCADSQQVYRGMDIGTAKPTKAEQGIVPHHLFDIAEPSEQFHVASYVAAARPRIESLAESGVLPIVVGGTGLYVHALAFGYSMDGGGESPALREKLGRRPLEELVRELERIAPDVRATVDVRNPRRVIRALERAQSGATSHPELTPPAWKPLILGISMEPSELRGRIADRVRGMFQRGFVDEVRALMAAYGPTAPGLQAIGYRDCIAVLQGREPREGLEARIALRTAQYAKRQRTWFRKTPGVHWLTVSESCARCDPHRPPVG